MEDYKQKYEQALERAKKWSIHPTVWSSDDICQKIFPELQESEDERIRKELIRAFTVTADKRDYEIYGNGITYRQVLAWLEKQVEQKPTDKVKPKFKKGDWVVYCNGDVDLITGIEDNGYLINEGGYIPFVCEDDMHLWTIQDAKDGDVIFSNDGHGSDSIELIKSIYDKRINFWFCLSSENNFKDYEYEVPNCNVPYTNFASRESATPATKEQRDLLFQKMKEAGYEWDAEKKELKKIEQKPAWSEEDELKKDTLIHIITNQKGSAIFEGLLPEELVNWLKSIKERMKGE